MKKIYDILRSIFIFCFVVKTALFVCSLSIVFADNIDEQLDEIKIIINQTNFVGNNKVFLKDVADIYANDFLVQELGKIELGTSPFPGRIKLFSKLSIVSTIEKQRYLPKNVTIESEPRIYVKRLSQNVKKEDIKQFVEQCLTSFYKYQNYEFINFEVKGLETYPKGKIDFFLNGNCEPDKKGKFNFGLDIIVEKEKVDTIRVYALIAVYDEVLFVNKSFKRGDSIQKEDTYKKRENIFEFSGNYIKNFDEIEYKILKSRIKKNGYLKAQFFEDPPLIKKGDIVNIVANKSPNLKIVAPGVSKENGFFNDVIKVENLNTGKYIRGIVKSRLKVLVLY